MIFTEEYLKKIGMRDSSSREIGVKDKVEFVCLVCNGVFIAKLCDVRKKEKRTGTGYCCRACTPKTIDYSKRAEKTEKVNLEKFGHKSAMQSDLIKERLRQKHQDRYGVDHPAKLPEEKQRRLKNFFKKHGVTCAFQMPVAIEKAKETNLKRFGHEYASQSEGFKEKVRKTNLKKLGVEYPSQSPDVREKVKNTNLKNLGCEYPSQSPEVREKALQTYISNDWASEGERELRDWISNSFPKYTVKKSYCGGQTPREIDILIKDANSYNKLAIEYNGDYFHSEARSSNKTLHVEKSKLVTEQKGCHLIHIFASEWCKRNLAVVSFLGSKLGECRNVRASKCQVKLVPFDEAKEFCEAFHIQGHPNSIHLALGLYLDNELLSLAAFSKPHRQNMTSEMHLSRFVTKPETRVYGGLSKLSKRAYELLGPFITFVHKRLSNGNSYEKTGYKKIKEIPPDYWYWDLKNEKTVSKQSRQKNIVKTPAGMTEREHALQDKLYRVWDCGKIKFIFNPE